MNISKKNLGLLGLPFFMLAMSLILLPWQSAPLFCPMGWLSEIIDCQLVLGSHYAKLAGIPFSVVGLALSLTLMTAVIFGLANQEDTWIRAVCFYLSLIGSMVAFALFIVSIVVIKKICSLCLFFDVFLWAFAVLAFRWMRQRDPTRSLFRVTSVIASLGLGFVTAVAGTFYFGQRGSSVRDADITEIQQAIKASTPVSLAQNAFDPILMTGDGTAEITVFSDFDCPYCSMAAQKMESVLEPFSGKVTLRFKHFPLDMSCNFKMTHPLHLSSCQKAVAAQCAFEQNHFKAFHDILFRDFKVPFADESLRTWIHGAGVNEKDLISCMNRPETMAIVKTHINEGIAAGVQGTPSIFVNGVIYPFPLQTENFRLFMKELGIKL